MCKIDEELRRGFYHLEYLRIKKVTEKRVQ